MQRTRTAWVGIVSMVAMTVWNGCGGGGGGSTTDAPSDPGGPDVPGEVATDVSADVPAAKCLGKVDAGKTLTLPGLKGPVEVVRDKWGIPHVYASSDEDLFFAQGFVVAQDRIIQMQGMRLITQGRFASTAAAGADDLDTDVYMRLLDFGGVAEKMWATIQKDEPGLKLALESFSAGVSAYIQAALDGKVQKPLEWTYLSHWDPWTPVDTLRIGRLQSWDLSFDFYTDDLTMMKQYQGLKQKLAGTSLDPDKVFADAYRTAPPVDATILPAPGAGGGGSRSAWVPAARAMLDRFPPGYFSQVAGRLANVRRTVPALGGGSNNWIVSGKLTDSGHAMVMGDPHLALRNPPVFYQIHLNTTRAGGDLDLAGVCFPGIPGVILGHSQHGAWMGTVHNYDVTDVYVETFSKDQPSAVMLDGAPVATTTRDETIEFPKPDKGCESWIAAGGLAAGLDHEIAEKDGTCKLTVHIRQVPHHGPVIPGSAATLADGTKTALTWRWTGFEPSGDLKAVAGLWRAKTIADFQDAIRSFGVGAQNWVWAGVDGHIAWAPWARVPIRKHVAAGKGAEHPPWLPMPGDGCCEWTGDVAKDKLPHAEDPAAGWLATANNDPNGTTLDNDPLNDGIYYGHTYDIGFREARIQELLRARFKDGKATKADFQAIQGDHLSPLGRALTPAILTAVGEAKKNGADPALEALLTPEVQAAADRLAAWDFEAASGLETEATDLDKQRAVATSIFNLWLSQLVTHVLVDKGLPDLESQYAAKLIHAMILTPDRLATWSAGLGDTALWDDLATPGGVETRHFVILKALGDALAKGAATEVFGTAETKEWLWGKVHTIVLPGAVGGESNIPPESAYPNGFPRHGDCFVVDSANYGFGDFDYRYDHGPSMRAAYVLDPAGVTMDNALPGGQDGKMLTDHYGDDFMLWARNQTHPVDFDETSVVADAEACLVLGKP